LPCLVVDVKVAPRGIALEESEEEDLIWNVEKGSCVAARWVEGIRTEGNNPA
jgi:hypothetical protein